MSDSGASGHFVAQVRLVFTLVVPKGSEKFPHENQYFTYVQPLEPPSDAIKDGEHAPDNGTGLFRVKRSHAEDKTRNGLIVNLNHIWRPIDLVPKFGKRCPRNWSSSMGCELAMEFFVNPFFDKETFASFTFY